MSSLTAVVDSGIKVGLPAKALPQLVTLKDWLAFVGVREVCTVAEARAYMNKFVREQVNLGLAGEMASWLQYRPEMYRLFGGSIPAEVGEAIRKAETIPDAHVLVSHYDEDPFVFVTRWLRGTRREEACIGYWNAPGFEPGSSPDAV